MPSPLPDPAPRHSLAPWLVDAGPLLLLAAAMLPRGWSDPRPAATAHLAAAAAGIALAAAIGAAAALAAHGPVAHVFGGPLGIYFDALSAVMLLLVAFIGLVVVRYARRYLDGDPGQSRFLRALCLALAAVLTLAVSGNLAMLAAAWIATSLALHRLLVFYPHRPGAQLAARKKFIASRVGDACVIAAAVLVYQGYGTIEFGTLFAPGAALAAAPAELPWIAALVVFAAILKSAQFPFHGWLPEVMETPTPVSALLHAGIVNAGGFLVVRMSPLLVQADAALDALAVVGAVTALFGAAVMLTQTSIKGSLAWSTIAQMGFMLLQCGLGAFAAAVLHIVAHSLYKAHAFLSSGSVVDAARAAWTPAASAHAPVRAAVLALLAALVTAVALGASLSAQPGIVALGAIVAMGVAHLVLQARGARPDAAVMARAGALAAVVTAAWFALQAGADRLLAGTIAPAPSGSLVLPMLVVAAFAAAFMLQALLPHRADRPRWRAAYVHLANGLYVNTIANRLVARLWPLAPHGTRSRA